MEHTFARPFYFTSLLLPAKAQKNAFRTITDTAPKAHKGEAARTSAAYRVSTELQIQRKRRQDFRDGQQYIEHSMLSSERYNPYTLFL